MPHTDGTTEQVGDRFGGRILSVLCENTRRTGYSARATTIPTLLPSTTRRRNSASTTKARWCATTTANHSRSALLPNDLAIPFYPPTTYHTALTNGYPANDIIQMQKSKAETMSRSQMLAWINRTLNVRSPTLRSTKHASRTSALGSSTASCSTTSSPMLYRSAKSR
jgi:hypothetical protein